MIDLKELDVVYSVKQHENNDELRYSLRTLKNLPHRNVYIVGYKPEWANVKHIPSIRVSKNKVTNTDANWEIVANNQEVSDPFILFNDDFFVNNPIKELPAHYLKTQFEHEEYFKRRFPNSYYTQVASNTSKRLKILGIDKPLCHEAHTPMVIYKNDIKKALNNHDYHAEPVNIRTLAANIGDYKGIKILDVKVYGTRLEIDRSAKDYKNNDFISTDNRAFYHKVGAYIKEKFNERCEYEK